MGVMRDCKLPTRLGFICRQRSLSLTTNASWCTSRANIATWRATPLKPEEKRRLNAIAVDYAKRAVALGPNDPDAQLAVAISYGKLQPLEGNWDKIQASHIIKDAADKVVKLDPHNDLGWHVLGRWHQGVADVSAARRALAQVIYGEVLPQSTYEEAAKCFQKAIELNPNRLMHYIELGRVYAQMGRTEDARRLITKGLSMQDTEKDDPETKREGQDVLAKLH